ncbi:DUF3108 domain-containing protein [Psychrobacter sp. YP14]|jgi:hypothetical protein|uniref:DUF3108 domain-containing protein n=1 Tax=Psychrobacter raelei TaxID=2565531 RepID=A0AAT9PF14_9GAMM|nr:MULTISPECIES: DUF3108 domain-containing protein [unclassified Psychrobacter]AWT48654.1 DUF3108 domain-containing protein [Psychrobacter sp. YP14]UNK05959.1 DUF3108 domain-containing protein [Psychrobacter sp. PraFG1]
MLNTLKNINTKKLATTLGLATATAVASTVSMAASTLTPTTADYNFTAEGKYKGTATRSLTKSGNNWNYKMSAKVAGVASANQNSSFILSGNSIIPTSASTTYKLFGVGRTHKVAFSDSGKKVVSTYRGKSYNLSAPNRAFDDLSLEAQIRQDLLTGKFTGNYYMVKKDKVEKTPFKKAGNTKITVPAGTFDTVRVDRIHDDKSRSTSFWLAPSLDYLPVKVVQSDDGKKMEMELTKVR